MDEREILETSFRQCVLRILVATSTLSSGVNLPARRVIVRSPMFSGRPLDILTYKQMIGRAGRMGKDTAGESFLLCKATERRVGELLVKGSLPAVQSCLGLGDLSSSLKRAVLEVIASGVVSSLGDVEEYTACTLFAACHKTESSKSMDEPISACLNFLKSNEFIKVSDDGHINPTSLGEACLSASLPPDQALRLLSELHKARQCFVLDSELHVIYQVTPFSVSEQWRQMDWMSALALWEGLSASMQRVGELVGVEERFLVRAIRGNINNNSSDQMEKLSIFRRFYTALALQDLVNEVPLVKVSEKFKCSKGMLQSLQQSSSTFAGMVTQFCRRLGWSSMELLVSQFADRLHFGVHRELIDLLRIDCISAVQARALFNAKIQTLSKLATAKVEKVQKALRNAIPFESNKIETAANNEDKGRKHVWLTGRSSRTEREAAHLIIREAREFLQAELGLETAKWTEECSLAMSENEGQTSDVESNLENYNKEAENFPEGSLTQFQSDEQDLIPDNAVQIGLPETNKQHDDKKEEAEQDTILVTSAGETSGRAEDDDKKIENSQIFETQMESLNHSNASIALNDNATVDNCLVQNEANSNAQIELQNHQHFSTGENNHQDSFQTEKLERNDGTVIKPIEENCDRSGEVNVKIDNNNEAVKSQKHPRHSIDLFESSCESSSSFNLEYTITPPPSTPTSSKNEAICKETDEDDHDQIDKQTMNADNEDLDMFENNEIDKNVNFVAAEKPKSEFKFPTQDGDFNLKDLNLSEEIFGKPDDSRRSDNFNDAVAFDDSKIAISQYEADTIVVNKTTLPETSLNSNSPDVFLSNGFRLKGNIRVSTPLSNVNAHRNMMELFKQSPICDNVKSKHVIADVRPSSLEDMDSNWGGGSLLESSFLFSAVETKKRKLSLHFEDDAKRLKTSHNFEEIRNDDEDMSILIDQEKNEDQPKVVSQGEPVMKKRRTSLFDSLTVDTQLCNVLDHFGEPGPSKFKTPPVKEAIPKADSTEIDNKVNNCDFFDEDFIPATPSDRTNAPSDNYSSNKLLIFSKVPPQSLQEDVNDDDDCDTIAGTPVEKCSSLLNKSISSIQNIRFSKRNNYTPPKKYVTSNELKENSVHTTDAKSSIKSTVSEEIIKPPVLMGPPSVRGNRRPTKKLESLLFPELHSKRQNGSRPSVNNELSNSLLEAAAGMQSLYEFNKTNANNQSLLQISKPDSISDKDGVTTTSNFNIDDYIISSQDDISLMSSGVYTRAMAAKINASSDVITTSSLRSETPTVNKRIEQSPSTSKPVSSPLKKSQSPGTKKTQTPTLSVTTEYVCTDCLKLQHFEKELAKKRIVSVGLDVLKQGESRSKSIGARILGNRSQTIDTSGDFCYGNTTIIGIAIYWGESSLYYLNLKRSDCPCVPIIKSLFKQENVTIVMYDLKTNIKLLAECMKTDFWCQGSDPIIADWMFTPFSKCRSFQNMVKTNNIKCPQYDCNAAVGADTIKLWSLNLFLEKKLKQAELLTSYKSVEMPVQFTFSRMESIGFRFDREYAELLMDRVDIKMSELQETAFQIAGRKFNMRSKADLNKVLQILGDAHEGESVLSELVRKWGKLHTLKTKSLGPFLLETGARLYGCYTTCTQTGRVSMKLQNVPKDLQIDDEVFSLRSAFLPSPGFVLVSSDYCQLELRLLAHLSQDTSLLDAFRTCDDVFISIAASWHSIPDHQVTDEMRHHTKQICYGLIYGMGVTSLAEQLELTENDAREMMRSFEEAYPALQSYLTRVVAQCQSTKQVRTILNRVRYLPDIASKNSSLRSQAERQAVNTTVQGSAADIAKLGMLKVERKLMNFCPGSNILLQLHDELIYEVPETHLDNAVAIIRSEMENSKTLSVSLPVKIKVGPSWGQLALHNN